MNIDEYVEEVKKLSIYPQKVNPLLGGFLYTALGLAGEAGEVVDEVKKLIRNEDGECTPFRTHKIEKELGDLTFYLVAFFEEFKKWSNNPNLTLEDIYDMNIEKLYNRRTIEGLTHG